MQPFLLFYAIGVPYNNSMKRSILSLLKEYKPYNNSNNDKPYTHKNYGTTYVFVVVSVNGSENDQSKP